MVKDGAVELSGALFATLLSGGEIFACRLVVMVVVARDNDALVGALRGEFDATGRSTGGILARPSALSAFEATVCGVIAVIRTVADATEHVSLLYVVRAPQGGKVVVGSGGWRGREVDRRLLEWADESGFAASVAGGRG